MLKILPGVPESFFSVQYFYSMLKKCPKNVPVHFLSSNSRQVFSSNIQQVQFDAENI